MERLPAWARRAIQRADKHARIKQYRCLYPGCSEQAVRCHSIQRAACVEALAVDGKLYSLAPSFTNQALNRSTSSDGMIAVKVGVNEAGTFKGFCGPHDHDLFNRAEASRPERRSGMFIALHFRSVTLEYCRKRRNADFFGKLAELAPDKDLAEHYSDLSAAYRSHTETFRDLYLGSLFSLIFGLSDDTIEYFCLPFTRNLEVSCCGMLNVTDDYDSGLGFNLISFSDVSILALTIFADASHYLDEFLAGYPIPHGAERLVNDVAFRRCEEPLLAPSLWERLGETQQLLVRLNLRSPQERWVEVDNRIVRITLADLMEPTPEHLSKISKRILLKPGDLQMYGRE